MLVLFLSGFLMFVVNWGHVLSSLIALEVMALSIYAMFSLGVMSSIDSYSALFFIAVAVCEGALGLSILVAFTFIKGSDKMSSFMVLEW